MLSLSPSSIKKLAEISTRVPNEGCFNVRDELPLEVVNKLLLFASYAIPTPNMTGPTCAWCGSCVHRCTTNEKECVIGISKSPNDDPYDYLGDLKNNTMYSSLSTEHGICLTSVLIYIGCLGRGCNRTNSHTPTGPNIIRMFVFLDFVRTSDGIGRGDIELSVITATSRRSIQPYYVSRSVDIVPMQNINCVKLLGYCLPNDNQYFTRITICLKYGSSARRLVYVNIPIRCSRLMATSLIWHSIAYGLRAHGESITSEESQELEIAPGDTRDAYAYAQIFQSFLGDACSFIPSKNVPAMQCKHAINCSAVLPDLVRDVL
jgi:ferredoxin